MLSALYNLKGRFEGSWRVPLLALLALIAPLTAYGDYTPTLYTVTFADGSNYVSAKPGDTITMIAKYQEPNAGQTIRIFGDGYGMAQSQALQAVDYGSTNMFGDYSTMGGVFSPAMVHDCRLNTNAPCTNLAALQTYTMTYTIPKEMSYTTTLYMPPTYTPTTVKMNIAYGEHFIQVPLSACNATKASQGTWVCSAKISANANLTVNILSPNSAPVVANGSMVLDEDAQGTLTATSTDADVGDTASYSISSQPAFGTATMVGDKLTYVPPANWSGTTTLTYVATDNKGAVSAPATVTITVRPVNDPPVVVAKSLTTNEDTPGTVTLEVIDPDIPYGDTHTFQIESLPGVGTAAITGTTLTYTPPADWSGSTSLTYKVKDAAGVWSSPVTVTITVLPVNDAPIAQPKTIVTDEDTPGSATLSATDIDSPAPTVFEVVSGPANGAASISGSTLTYTPAANWSGSTSLTYRAQDSSGAWSAPATVTITVKPVNDVPVAVAKTLVIDEDTSGTVALEVIDPDIPYGDTHTFELVATSPNGTAVISGSSLIFTPAADWNGSTTVSYLVKDSAGAYSTAALVTITVKPVNDIPVAQVISATTEEDSPIDVTLVATDIDSPVPTIFQIVTPPNSGFGAAAVSANQLTFTPVANWHGTATMTYRAQDTSGAWSLPVTVTIVVNSVNDVPQATASGLSLETIESKTVTTKYQVNQ